MVVRAPLDGHDGWYDEHTGQPVVDSRITDPQRVDQVLAEMNASIQTPGRLPTPPPRRVRLRLVRGSGREGDVVDRDAG